MKRFAGARPLSRGIVGHAPLYTSQATVARPFRRLASSSPDEETRMKLATRGHTEEFSDEQRDSLAAVLGTPVETLKRKVIIYIPPRCTMQSGVHSSTYWKLSFPEEEHNHWSNPLMGWTATKDPVSNLHLKFDTKEAAIAYCKKHAYDFEVDDSSTPYEQITPGKDYADNFKHKTPLNLEPDIY